MSVNMEFVERCQLEYQKNPSSKIFAPLAEAYRQMGLLDEALRISKLGVQIHPNFAGGRVSYAKVLLALKQNEEALSHLEKATQLSPDNLLAHSLMGETLIELRRPKEALKAFKMVLFLSPHDERARQTVKKWEFLTADEYSAEVFEMKPVFQNNGDEPGSVQTLTDDPAREAKLEALLFQDETDESDAQNESDFAQRETLDKKNPKPYDTRLALAQRHAQALDRAISLADAFTIRNDLEAALHVIHDAKRLLGPMPELENRFRLISRRLHSFGEDEIGSSTTLLSNSGDNSQSLERNATLSSMERDRRRNVLEGLLQRIAERRIDSHQ
jgi:tetratricopeptide (TPR) repeat protein